MSDLPTLGELSREEIILAKHYFEHGDIQAALSAAGYKGAEVSSVKRMLQRQGSLLNEFYSQLCRDRMESTVISTEKKRVKLWKLAEWAANERESDATKLNDPKLALQCLDMLNRMDGDYAAVEINTRQQMQIQKQTVNFQQRIPPVEKVDRLTNNSVDNLLEMNRAEIQEARNLTCKKSEN